MNRRDRATTSPGNIPLWDQTHGLIPRNCVGASGHLQFSVDMTHMGALLDYSSAMYRVDIYCELGEHQGMARQAIEAYLGPERARNLTALPYGYECELTIQVVPDIVRELAAQSIAVYQVVRYAKTKNVWT